MESCSTEFSSQWLDKFRTDRQASATTGAGKEIAQRPSFGEGRSDSVPDRVLVRRCTEFWPEVARIGSRGIRMHGVEPRCRTRWAPGPAERWCWGRWIGSPSNRSTGASLSFADPMECGNDAGYPWSPSFRGPLRGPAARSRGTSPSRNSRCPDGRRQLRKRRSSTSPSATRSSAQEAAPLSCPVAIFAGVAVHVPTLALPEPELGYLFENHSFRMPRIVCPAPPMRDKGLNP